MTNDCNYYVEINFFACMLVFVIEPRQQMAVIKGFVLQTGTVPHGNAADPVGERNLAMSNCKSDDYIKNIHLCITKQFIRGHRTMFFSFFTLQAL